MRAVIVAAGTASRLHPLTESLPKGLLDVGGRSMLDRSVDALERAGVTSILFVTGYLREQLEARFGSRAEYIFNPFYRETNNLASFWMALDRLPDQPLLYLHGDLVYDPELIPILVNREPTGDVELLVDHSVDLDEEAMKVRVNGDHLVESNKTMPVSEAAGEWVGIARFTPAGMSEMRREAAELLAERQFQVYDTLALTRLAARNIPIVVRSTEGRRWVEVDFQEDLDRARRLFPADRSS